MGILEPWHLILILAIVLIIFGPGKLPDIGKAMGKTIKEFRQASSTDPGRPASEHQACSGANCTGFRAEGSSGKDRLASFACPFRMTRRSYFTRHSSDSQALF